MTDFITCKEKIDSLLNGINSTLDKLYNMPEQMKNDSVLDAVMRVKDVENHLQNIISNSDLWTDEEKEASRRYVTLVRTQITEIQTRLHSYQTMNNEHIFLKEEDFENPLIYHSLSHMELRELSNQDVLEQHEVRTRSDMCKVVLPYLATAVVVICLVFLVIEVIW